MTHTTDLIATIDAIIRRERIPDRAGAAIVETLGREGLIVPTDKQRRLIDAAVAVSQNFTTMDDGRYAVADPWFTDLMLATSELEPEGFTVVRRVCDWCNGTGKSGDREEDFICPKCDGRGVLDPDLARDAPGGTEPDDGR